MKKLILSLFLLAFTFSAVPVSAATSYNVKDLRTKLIQIKNKQKTTKKQILKSKTNVKKDVTKVKKARKIIKKKRTAVIKKAKTAIKKKSKK